VDLAIPQHRIVYFKYKDTKVWDKTQRLDLIFNSTVFQGDFKGKTIEEVMQQIDDRLELAKFGGGDERDGENAENESSESDSESSDSENDVAISIKPIEPAEFKSTIPDEERSTHFIAIRITEPEIIENAIKIQQHMVQQEEAIGDCCMGSGLFHMTLAMMRLNGQEGIDEATKMVEDLQEELQELLDKRTDRKIGMKISGLDTFGQRVLFAKVLPESDDLFWQFIGTVLDKLAKSSPAIGITNKFDLTPHMTLVKINRPISKLRKSKFLPSRLYEQFEDMELGRQPLNNLQLCVIEATTRHDGFYRTLSEIKFKI
jgi:2'-5' RNA ligase